MPKSPAMIARDQALLALKEMHPKDYARLYDAAREGHGLRPLIPRKKNLIKHLEHKLQTLREEVGDA